MKKMFLFIGILGLLIIACENEGTVIPHIKERLLAGGETTVFSITSAAFSNPATNLSGSSLERHLNGDKEFESIFVTAGSPINSGLGPRFNNSSCESCHPKDGRSNFPENIKGASGLLYAISVGNDMQTGPIPVPNYGKQAQNQSTYGLKPELEYTVVWKELVEVFPDGERVSLRKPEFGFENPYMPLPNSIFISPRIAPPVFGLGLLEFIPEKDILALSEYQVQNNDGISGKANYVRNPETGKRELGRFGWKAGTPSVRIQTALAYHEDIGITNSIFKKEAISDGHDNDPEITEKILDDVTLYTQTLAVPAPRDIGSEAVRKGAILFEQIQCSSCHTPKQQTKDAPIAALTNQVIWPYTDMLLHDMGEGLADNRPEFLATGREWRTRPLWGIGLTQVVNGHMNFLHDGRARNLVEAILWHGGEAEQSKQKFKRLTKKEREEILSFLNTL